MNFMKLYIGDYQRDTGHLSISEHGAYLLMLQHHYATEKPLPIGKALHRLLRAESRADRAAIDSIVSQFWEETEAGLINRRSGREIQKADHQRAVNQEVGKLGGRPRKTESKTESVIEIETESKANRNPNQTPDTRHQTPDLKPNSVERASTDQPPGSASGRVCARLRKSGIQGVNPSNPKLLALLGDGVPEDEFCDLADEPIAKGKGMAWILAAVEGRRRDAAARAVILPEPIRARPVCAICGAEASKRIGRTDFCPQHDQFSGGIAA